MGVSATEAFVLSGNSTGLEYTDFAGGPEGSGVLLPQVWPGGVGLAVPDPWQISTPSQIGRTERDRNICSPDWSTAAQPRPKCTVELGCTSLSSGRQFLLIALHRSPSGKYRLWVLIVSLTSYMQLADLGVRNAVTRY